MRPDAAGKNPLHCSIDQVIARLADHRQPGRAKLYQQLIDNTHTGH